MKHSIEQKEQDLETLLSQLLQNKPSEADSSLRLLAFARLYGALYRFITINNNDDRYGNRRDYVHRAEDLFQILFNSASSSEKDFTERARLVSALYTLSTEAMPFYDAQRDELAGEALAGLMDHPSALTATDSIDQPIVCRCLVSYFYPELCPDDHWSLLLQHTVRDWAERQSADGFWEGVSTPVALARIEAMNAYSYMFLDNSYDVRIEQAYHHYVSSLVENSFTHAAESLYALTARYDLSMQGNAYSVDGSTADATADAFYKHSHHYMVGSDEWYYCLACYAAHLCEQVTAYYQHEILQNIA